MSINRCAWCGDDPLYIKYHDKEWGIPVLDDDNKLFAMLILEGAQAGLSWITILRKRENYYKAFDNFNIKKVSQYKQTKINQLLQNPGIVRNKLKINSAISNAKAFIKIQQEFGSFAAYWWKFVDYKPIKNSYKALQEIPATTKLSDLISCDLKKRGFKFTGSTIIYAYMQAVGMVNDHLTSCFRYQS